jgi:hypothetical protein
VKRGFGVGLVSVVAALAVAAPLVILANDPATTADPRSATVRGVLQLQLVGSLGVTTHPVAGSIVVLQRGDPFSQEYDRPFKTVTDAGGAFSLSVPPGSYAVIGHSDQAQGRCGAVGATYHVGSGRSVDVVVTCPSS